MKLVLLGPPGTGKGTQAKLISKKLKISLITTGDIIRKEIAKKTKLGILAKKYNDKGLLIPDKYIVEIVKNKIKNKKNYLIDGFPRNLKQAKMFDNKNVDKVIYIYSTKNIIIKRLLKRAKIEGRKDDTPEVIKKRIEVYKKETKPLLEYYKDKLVKVKGEQNVEYVFKDIVKAL